MLVVDPNKRVSVQDILNNKWFKMYQYFFVFLLF